MLATRRSSECRDGLAHNPLDAADIVRDACLQQLAQIGQLPRSLLIGGSQATHERSVIPTRHTWRVLPPRPRLKTVPP
jgi:hypothetical protein